MFSIMTMASSTTKPVAMVSAINVRLLTLNPSKYMMAKVPTSESGTTTLGMKVAVQVRKKANVTSTTKVIAMTISVCTWRTDSRMVWVRSAATVRSTPAGNPRCNSGNKALTRSTT